MDVRVPHAMWEDYHGQNAADRPERPPSRGERNVATRAEVLGEFTLGT